MTPRAGKAVGALLGGLAEGEPGPRPTSPTPTGKATRTVLPRSYQLHRPSDSITQTVIWQ